MDCLELRMDKRALDDDRIVRARGMLVSFVQELLEVIQCVRHLGNRRRNEGRVCKTSSLGTDPVLRNTEFTRRFSFPSDTTHELGVDFPDQPKTKRELGKTPDAVVQRPDVIDDLLGIVKPLSFGWSLPSFEPNHFIERRVDSLDLRTEQGFLAHVHADEKVRIGKSPLNSQSA